MTARLPEKEQVKKLRPDDMMESLKRHLTERCFTEDPPCGKEPVHDDTDL